MPGGEGRVDRRLPASSASSGSAGLDGRLRTSKAILGSCVPARGEGEGVGDSTVDRADCVSGGVAWVVLSV